MKLKLNLLAVAVAALAGASAHAAPNLGGANGNGNGSAFFVAMDDGLNISLGVDLGARFVDFLSASPLTSGAGSLSAAGTVATWNLKTNAFSLNGVAGTGTYDWGTSVNSFLTNSNVSGGAYKWGILSNDNVQGVITPTNLVKGNNVLMTTGLTVDFTIDNNSGTNNGNVSGAAGAIQNFFAGSTGQGTQTAGKFGANTATSGAAFVGNNLASTGAGDFGNGLGSNDFLVSPTSKSYFMWGNQGGIGETASVFALGAPNNNAFVTSAAATWTWDGASGVLTYVVPVPEPSAYAMLIAGIAVMGLMGRRRFKA